MIDKDNKIIYVQIPKNGSVSLSSLVFSKDIRDHRTIYDYKIKLKDFESYNSIAFIRNPLERMVSIYAFLNTYCWDHKIIKGLFFNDFLIQNLKDFEHKGYCSLTEHHPKDFDDVKRFSERSSFWMSHQKSWLLDENNKIIVKNIYPFEKIEDVMLVLKEKYSYSGPVGVFNKTERRHHYVHYKRGIQNMVFDKYKEDFDLYFNSIYNFNLDKVYREL